MKSCPFFENPSLPSLPRTLSHFRATFHNFIISLPSFSLRIYTIFSFLHSHKKNNKKNCKFLNNARTNSLNELAFNIRVKFYKFYFYALVSLKKFTKKNCKIFVDF